MRKACWGRHYAFRRTLNGPYHIELDLHFVEMYSALKNFYGIILFKNYIVLFKKNKIQTQRFFF